MIINAKYETEMVMYRDHKNQSTEKQFMKYLSTLGKVKDKILNTLPLIGDPPIAD